MRVRPKTPGVVIRDPYTRRRLPDEGGRVPNNTFWRRRLRSGDVVPVENPQPAAAKEAHLAVAIEEPLKVEE